MIEVGQLFTLPFLDGTRFLLGVYCHAYSGERVGMLSRFYTHCPAQDPTEAQINLIVENSPIAFSSIGHVGGFRTGFYAKRGVVELSEEFTDWPMTFSSKMWPFPSRLLVVDPKTGSSLAETEVEDSFFHPMIPNNGFGAIKTNQFLADHYWSTGILRPFEDLPLGDVDFK